MRPPLTRLLPIVVFLLAINQLFAQSVDTATTKKIDALFKQWDNKNSPGCAIGIIRNDSLIYAKGYGMANLEYQVPITTKTIFEMGSISKQFTAYAIMLLAHEGKLRLDDDIHKYLPWVPNFEKKITIANLLYHTSGIRDYDQLLAIEGTGDEDVITREQVIKVLSKQRTLNFDPGQQYMYSNSGYFLLGEIVHAVTGKTLRRFTDSAIFKPLGMNNTHFHDDYTEVVNNKAYPYMTANKVSIVNSSAVGAKGLFTNIDDMSKWAIAFCDNKSAFYPIIQQLTVPGKLNSGKGTGVGAGIQMYDFGGSKVYFHGGIDGGYHNNVEYRPAKKMALVLFSNDGSSNMSYRAELIDGLFIKGQSQGKAETAIKLLGDSVITDTASVLPLLGSYVIEDGNHAAFKLTGKKFYFVLNAPNGKETYLLHRTAKDIFWFRGFNPGVKFVFTVKNPHNVSVRQSWPNGYARMMIKQDPLNVPADKQLIAYTGKYYCSELDCSYRIMLKDHQLVLANSKYEDSPIILYDENRILNELDWMRTLFVIRDKKGKITGFQVHHNLIQDLRFEKIQ